MARKPTREEAKTTTFMRGYNDAQRGREKNNPFDPGLMHDNYEKGYESGKLKRKNFI